MVAHMPAAVLTGARTIDGSETNVLIVDETIAAVGDAFDAPADAERVDLTGYVLLPAAVEPHAHLDKAFLAELVINQTGDLYGAIEAMKASRHLTNFDDTVAGAPPPARRVAAKGYTARPWQAATTHQKPQQSKEARAGVGKGIVP